MPQLCTCKHPKYLSQALRCDHTYALARSVLSSAGFTQHGTASPINANTYTLGDFLPLLAPEVWQAAATVHAVTQILLIVCVSLHACTCTPCKAPQLSQ